MKVTERVFRDSAELRAELQQVLGTSAMVHALAILEEKSKVRRSPEPRPNAHLDTLTSQMFYKLQGRQQIIDELRNLVEPNPPVAEEREPDEVSRIKADPYFQSLPAIMQKAWLDKVTSTPDGNLT